MTHGNNILIPFDMIYDIDIGIFKLLKTKYNNPKFIDNIMIGISDNNFKYLVLKSDIYDPVRLLLLDEFKGNSSDILNELLSDSYNDIISLSEPTDILGLISVYIKTGMVKVTIVCKDHMESQIIRDNKLLKDTNILIQPDYNKIDISEYDSIFIKNFPDILKFKKVQGKSIFIGNYKFNQEKNSTEDEIKPLQDITILIGDVNRIYFIDIYTIDESYPIYG